MDPFPAAQNDHVAMFFGVKLKTLCKFLPEGE